MADQQAKKRLWRGASRRLVAFYVLALLAVVASFLVASRLALDTAFREAELETQYTAKVLQQHLERALEAVDLSLLHAIDHLRGTDFSRVDRSEEHWRDLVEAAARLPQVRTIWLADASGRVILCSTSLPAPDMNVGRQDYFQKAAALDRGSYVGPLLIGMSSNRPFFSLSRPVRDAKGRLLGVLTAGLEPSFFSDFHSRTALGKTGAVALLSDDGTVISRYPFVESLIGQKAPLTALREALALGRKQGTLSGECANDGPGGPSVLSFLRLTHRPLVVVATKRRSEIQASLLRWLPLLAGPLTLSLAFMSALFFVHLRKTREEDEARAALAESEARFRLVADNAEEIISLHAGTGRALYVSPACRRVLGYGQEQMLRLPLPALVHPEDRRQLRQTLIQPVFRGRRHAKVTVRARHANGSFRWMETSLAPVLDEQGKVIQTIAISRDVTERLELEQLKEHVEQITRHDLKTPLICALSVPRLLRSHGNLRPDQLHLLEQLERTSRKMLDMINRSLDLYKLEAGIYAVRPAPVDLLAVVRAGVDELSGLAQARKVRMRVLVEEIEPGPDTVFPVQAEELLLHSLFQNLLTNALEAAPQGGEVCVRLSRGQGRVRLSLHNPGCVPEPVRERFFEKYATFGKEFGTGLGTYAARLIAEVHGGSAGFDSDEESGTTVWVDLPDKTA